MTAQVTTQFTNGFGNNLFQYCAAHLLAEYHDATAYAVPPTPDYYGIPDLKALGIEFWPGRLPTMLQSVSDANYTKMFDSIYKGAHFHLNGYFEDYRFYINHIEKIKSWFPLPVVREDSALVLHMRTGDRLFMKNEFYSKPRVDSYKRAIDQFEFSEFHIVTDMPTWEPVTPEELQAMKFHVNTLPDDRVPIEDSVKYFNELVEGFAPYNPQVTRRTVGEDFNFIRSFNNILFEHGTLSWWAAALSDAKKVGVYGPWRPWKGAKNKNLSQIPLSGWFRWD